MHKYKVQYLILIKKNLALDWQHPSTPVTIFATKYKLKNNSHNEVNLWNVISDGDK